MKKQAHILVILFLMQSCFFWLGPPLSGQQNIVSFQIFYDNLSPYGQWVNNPSYGYVWIPSTSDDFSPYVTAGHWVITDYGWTWVSDYKWGWAPFHYGRWDRTGDYGWFWIPDNEWGPSWVIWKRGQDFFGWAPMMPGTKADMSFIGKYPDLDRWIFVRDNNFGRPDLDKHYINKRNNDFMYKNSVVLFNYFFDDKRGVTYVTGPTSYEVQTGSRRRINFISIHNIDTPGESLNNNELQLYRPIVEMITDEKSKPVPLRVVDLKDLNKSAELINNSLQAERRQNRYQEFQSKQHEVSTQNQTKEQNLQKKNKEPGSR